MIDDMELIFATTDPDDIFLYLKKIVLPIVYSFWILISVRILTASILLNKLEGITSSHKLSLLLHQELAIKTLQRTDITIKTIS